MIALSTEAVSFDKNSKSKDTQRDGSSQVYVEVSGTKELPNNNVVISDRYVQSVDPNANIIVLDSQGQAYSVRSGTVLASDVVIHSSEGKFYAYRVDDPEKSVNY